MRKFLATSGCLIASAFLLTSCLEEETLELSPYADITSFSINDISTQVHSLTATGKDTITTVKVTGANYLFSIDHNAGLIYNQDSLPKGTDVTKVTVNIGYEGGYILYGHETAIYDSEDSIDFTHPVPFTVYAADGEGSRSYYVRLNVHRSDMDSLLWTPMSGTRFAGEQMDDLKALTANGVIHVFAQTREGLSMTSASTTDGMWSSLTPANGVSGDIDLSSVNILDGTFYLLADDKLYHSTDGLNWNCMNEAGTFDQIVTAVDGQLWLKQGNKLLAGNASDGWEEMQTIIPEYFPAKATAVSTPLRTNESIRRTILMGMPENATDSCATVWSKLSTEKGWTHYNETTYGCPSLEGLTVLCINDIYYAFGGKSIHKNEKIEAFEAVYTSSDGGITWKKTSSIRMPDELVGMNGKFSCVMDESHNIWLMCSGKETVYKGHMNVESH